MPRDVTYSSYLDLDRILSAQHPASAAHDELLFIIVHQASELWLKLCLHELNAARAEIAADDLRPAFKMLARVARAQSQLISSWDVLSTMTPADYSEVRPHLASSSGFQSAQYRLMEFLLGGRNPDMVTMHEATPEVAAALRRRGPAVHVIAPDKIPMARVLGPELGTFIRSLHESHGVTFHLERTVQGISDGSLILSTGERLPADFVVAGVGVRPRLDLAQDAGLALDGGILTDEFLESSQKGIFAAGLWLVVLGILSVLLRVVVFLFGGLSPREVNLQIGHVEADV